MREPILNGTVKTEQGRSRPFLRAGNMNCGGCGMSNILQLFGHAVAEREVKLVIPACCGAVTAAVYPQSAFDVPTILATFASASAVATGIASVARLNNEDTRVVCLAGDGGTYDIGLATLSASAERNENILYICYDNELYGNTGGQRSSSTPAGAATSSTPGGKPEVKKDIMAIMAAHRIPYAATVSIAHPTDAVNKMRTALDTIGFRFLHILSPCPSGWKSEPAMGIELIRLAVRSGLFPIYEVFDGDRYVINIEPDFSDEALAMYLSLQRRFQKSGVTESSLRPGIEQYWHRLRLLSGRIVPARRI